MNQIRALADTHIDFLFIDGDHTYEGVKSDFEMYSPLVRSGGLIALHDIVPGPEGCVGGVPKYWSELKADRFDIIDEIVLEVACRTCCVPPLCACVGNHIVNC